MNNVRGFSLVEIAVVLVIIAILITAVGIPLATQIDQQRVSDTQKQLKTIEEALYGFMMSNGRLPCPATLTSMGRESFCTNSNAYPTATACGAEVTTGYSANGRCFSTNGFIPAVTLSLAPIDEQGYSLDAWGLQQNRIRYAVSGLTIPATTLSPVRRPFCLVDQINPLTKTDGIRTATMGCIADADVLANLLTITSTMVNNAPAGCSPSGLTTKAPFVIFSVGKNAPTGGVGADEAQNLLANATTFVSHTPTATGNCAGEFDDIVTWGNLNTLFARMVQAGRLP